MSASSSSVAAVATLVYSLTRDLKVSSGTVPETRDAACERLNKVARANKPETAPSVLRIPRRPRIVSSVRFEQQ